MGENWGAGLFREFVTNMYRLRCLKWITNKDLLLVGHRGLCSMLHGSLEGKGVCGREGSCILWLSPFVPLLFTGNYHFVKQLDFNIK